RTNAQHLAGTLENSGAKQLLRASNSRAAGRCYVRTSRRRHQEMAQKAPRARLRSRNLHGHCCAATELSFAVCSSARVLASIGTTWGEFIAAGKRAARFAAAISWEE